MPAGTPQSVSMRFCLHGRCAALVEDGLSRATCWRGVRMRSWFLLPICLLLAFPAGSQIELRNPLVARLTKTADHPYTPARDMHIRSMRRGHPCGPPFQRLRTPVQLNPCPYSRRRLAQRAVWLA